MDISVRKENSITKLIILMILAIFCLPGELRTGIFGHSLGIINYIAIFLLLYLLLYNLQNINYKYIIFVYITILYYLLSSLLYENKLTTIITVVCSHLIPLLLIGVKIPPDSLKKVFTALLKTLNTIMITITIIGMIEFVTNIDIFVHIAKFMTARFQELLMNQQSRSGYRLYSFMGHPLFNTQLYLMFFTLNMIYNNYFQKLLSEKIVVLIALIGIAMTASKTGFLLIFIAIIFLLYKKSSLKYLVSIFVLFTIIAILVTCTDLFANTLSRFAEGSLTTGRAEKWEEVSSLNYFPIKFFIGYGHGFTFVYNNYIDWASAAFEYPFRMFSLELGVFLTIFIYISIGVYPMLKLIQRRQFYLLMAYLIVFVDVNTYNGLSLTGDYMLVFTLYIFIILNVSNLLITKGFK
ncbi:O-antigen ligase family protein [Bacillus sp. FJAT-27986]|uniref:O-antigen ligase family protein n=1 Tax=Bacillus sp. FJAT-27986 TaxID=1743146 RepID=UPI00080AF546|nr:O-antigen ligase family protein [Bacillus sp. FJAT-27986]OCA84625.1 hypothetical protein A8L44_09490 [Bacillus sp. FJAT-27986]